jgi:hypothetical protein
MTANRIALMFTASVLFGCSGASNEDYARLAQAGNAYTTAMDKMLVTTGKMRVDATSEKLLENNALADVSRKQYDDAEIPDDELLDTIDELRQQNRLLGRYFSIILELATSNAPQRASESVSSIGSSLEGITAKLAPSVSKPVSSLLASLTKLAVSERIRGALRDELDQRQITIRKALYIEADLFQQLALDLQTSLNDVKRAKTNRLFNQLNAKELNKNPDQAGAWIVTRRAITTKRISAQDLEEASKATEEMRHAFEDLLTDKLTASGVKNLLADIDSISKIADSINADS